MSAPLFGYDTNGNGQSYGQAPLDRPGASERDFPDLVAVVGDNGIEGYVLAKQLQDPNANPATPEEALAVQATLTKDRVLPVFATDGHTKVDTFTVWGANHDVPMPDDVPDPAQTSSP